MKWEHDKIKHASISFVLVILLWLVTNELVVAMSGTFLVGMGKEAYDEIITPGNHWDNLLETGEARQDNFWRNYYLPQDQYEEIYDRICNEHRLTKREKSKVAFTVHLGASPTSVRPTGWDNEEN